MVRISGTDYLTIAEVAERLGVSRGRVWQLVETGRLGKPWTIGHNALLPERAVKAFRPRPSGRPRKSET